MMPAAHIIALAQAGERAYARFEWAGLPGGMTALGAAAAAVVVAVSATVFRFFEDPANRLIRGWARVWCS